MLTLFVTAFTALFSVVNPLGAMPIFLSLTEGEDDAERKNTATRASIYFVIILIVSFFIGHYILLFFGISIDALRIAGGLIILSSGYGLLSDNFAKSRSIDKKVHSEAKDSDDSSLTPIAIPLLAGPGSMSMLIGWFGEQQDNFSYVVISAVIISVGLVTFLILRMSPKLVKVLGVAGMKSVARIIGFITMAVGVQFIINGVVSVVKGIN